jgi:D-3-phosphoglycerate dehydrogenase
MIAAGKKLKVIGRAGVGVDTIDVVAAEQKGIKVVNAPGSNSRSVAEHAIGLMFALARMIPRADASMKAKKWEKKLFKGIELEGKTLVVLGYGNVGKIVADLAASIGMKVVVWSRSHDKTDKYPFYEKLSEVLAQAVFVTVHVPKMPETENLLNRKVFEGMKEGAFIVNTARGGIVNETDLLEALESGKVAGAALDVFENEPTPLPALVMHPRVIATPHIAAATKEAQARAGVMVVEKIIEWAAQPA